MLDDSIHKAYKQDWTKAMQNKSWMTKTTKIRPQAYQNMDKSFLESSQNHARKTCYNMMHIRPNHGIPRQVHEACMMCLNQVKKEVSNDKITLNTYWNSAKTN